MPTGEALKPERDPPGVLTGRTGKKEAPWVGLPRLPSFPWQFGAKVGDTDRRCCLQVPECAATAGSIYRIAVAVPW